MQLALCVENVCDYFALAHAHGLQELKDGCVDFMEADKNKVGVSQSEGFKRMCAERPLLLADIYKHRACMASPEGQSRKRKRSETG